MLKQTDDIDAFEAWQLEMGWDGRMTQLTRGRGRFECDVTSLGDLTIWRQRASHRVHCEYALPIGMVEMMVMRSVDAPVWCGLAVSDPAVVLNRGGRSLWTILPAGVVGYGLLLPEALALRWELVSTRALAEASDARRAILATQVEVLENAIRRIEALLDLASRTEQANDLQTLLDGVVTAFQAVLAPCPFETDEHDGFEVPGTALVHDALDLIAAKLHGSFTAGDIADSLGVTRRQLERTFDRVLGIAPYQFVLAHKLRASRQLLRRGCSSVLDASVQFGFENPGRFAGMYARHFGELPSETRRKA